MTDHRTKSGLFVPPGVDITEQVKQNGKLRRPGDGGRTASDFFAPERFDRPVTRGELINVVGMIEYGRRENHWWRRLFRWLRGWPQAKDMAALAAAAHGQTLHELRLKLEAAQREAPSGGTD